MSRKSLESKTRCNRSDSRHLRLRDSSAMPRVIHWPVSWSRQRLRYAVSAVLRASPIARSYAARDSSFGPRRRSRWAWVA
jgi:hypothetical protein